MNSQHGEEAEVQLSKHDARLILSRLITTPVAPGSYSYLINAGTDAILEALQKNYFNGQLAEGISCFKFVEGDYGTGKTQFINSLARRGMDDNIVVAIVSIGQECPFNSPHAIFKSVMGAFVPPPREDDPIDTDKGIEILVRDWIRRQLREMGVGAGEQVPPAARRQIETRFEALWLGAPDQQMSNALRALSRRLLDLECGGSGSASDGELIEWIRGGSVRSRNLKEMFGLYEPTKDDNAFKRLKTVVGFLRQRMGYHGFMIAFDEGGRVISFRRGTAKQKQAIENMLTMINENAEGAFGGVMFVYAATPEFRSEVISKTYRALDDRIGSIAFLPGSPETPLISLERLQSDYVLVEIGERLMDVFAAAEEVSWNRDLQRNNLRRLIEAQKGELAYLNSVPPRIFVYHCCALLSQQKDHQFELELEQMATFVNSHEVPETEA